MARARVNTWHWPRWRQNFLCRSLPGVSSVFLSPLRREAEEDQNEREVGAHAPQDQKVHATDPIRKVVGEEIREVVDVEIADPSLTFALRESAVARSKNRKGSRTA